MSRPVFTEVSTLGDLLLRAASEHPDRAGLVMPNRKTSFAELREGAMRVARSLVALGLEPGEHVALLLPNCPEFVEALFGVALAGGVSVPLNARHRAQELGFILNDAAVTTVITSRHSEDPVDFVSVLSEAIPSLADGDAIAEAPALRRLLLARGETSGRFVGSDALPAGDDATAQEVEARRRRVRLRDPALIIYTSGTTANPKGCVLCHEAVTRGPVERARYRLSADGHDVTWGAGPLFHIGSLAPFVGSVGAAGTYVTDTYFEPGRAVALLQDNGVTLAWPWFGAIVQGIIDHPDFDPEKLDRLRHLFMISPPTLVDRVQQLLPQTEVLQACGMTETAGVFALSDIDEDARSRSTTNGKPAAGMEVRIVDAETGQDLPDGTMGEIWVRGYSVMDGYWNAPEKTAETITADGWLKTGDLYTRLPGGSLVFGGRCKDMLKVGGENVAAIEVEAFLCTHPDVKIAEVVGRPDSRLDEVPVAFVELRDDADADEAALIAHCRGRIASYKVPRAVHFMKASEWPMSATKVDKRALRERLVSPD